MKLVLIIMVFATLACPTYAQLPDQKKYEVALVAGFGKQYARPSHSKTNDNRTIDYTQSFLKSFRLISRLAVSSRYAIGIDLGICYDYDMGYKVRPLNQKRFSIGGGAGTEIYSTWHVIINVYSQLITYRKFSLAGYGGAGFQLFPYDNYYKKETLQITDPQESTLYYHLPSSTNNRPIAVFNLGLEIRYALSKASTVFLQPSLRYGTKPFITDHTRIETTSASTILHVPMTGTHSLFSIGYGYSF